MIGEVGLVVPKECEEFVMAYAGYFIVLTCVWLVVWGVVLHAFLSRGRLHPVVAHLARLRVLVSLCLFGLIGYVISYAPAVQHDVLQGAHGEYADLYVPVDWLIDQTPARGALLDWAAVWEVEDEFVQASKTRLRSSETWGTAPAWLYGLGWLLWGVVCCVGPPYAVYRLVLVCRRIFGRAEADRLVVQN